MNPFYFGTSAKRLYGVFHPPRSSTPRDRGVVLCYPFGQEYMRAHRAFRQLTTLLTKAGYPVLRFDYYGTGDSGGGGEEGSLTQWADDVGTAIQELKDTAAVAQVSLVGLRLGAALALRAAGGRSDIADLVIWDPVVDGAAYITELLAGSGHAPNGNGRPHVTGTVGILGFPLTAEMRGELEQVDLTRLDMLPARRTWMVVSHESPLFSHLRTRLEALEGTATYELHPSPGNWNEVDNFGSVLMPQQIIQGIVECLT